MLFNWQYDLQQMTCNKWLVILRCFSRTYTCFDSSLHLPQEVTWYQTCKGTRTTCQHGHVSVNKRIMLIIIYNLWRNNEPHSVIICNNIHLHVRFLPILHQVTVHCYTHPIKVDLLFIMSIYEKNVFCLQSLQPWIYTSCVSSTPGGMMIYTLFSPGYL